MALTPTGSINVAEGRVSVTLDGQRPPTTNAERSGQGGGHYGRSERMKAWRQTTHLWCRNKYPKLSTPVGITVTPLHKDRRSPQDAGACAPAAKAMIDGLVDAGVIPGDSPEYVRWLQFEVPHICGVNGLRIEVVTL